MTRLSLYLLLMGVLLYSCKNGSQSAFGETEKDVLPDDTQEYQLTKGSSINLPLDNSVSIDFSDVQLYHGQNDKLLISLFDPTVPRLHIYDYPTMQKIKRIDFALQGPDGVGGNTSSMGHFLYAPDTIIIYNYWDNKLLVFDINGRKLSATALPAPDESHFSCQLAYANAFRRGTQVFLPNTYQGVMAGQLIPAADIPAFLVFDLADNSLASFGQRSEVYDMGYNVAGDNSMVFGNIGSSKEILYSFKKDHHLYRASTAGKVEKYPLGSEYFADLPPFSESFRDGFAQENASSKVLSEYVLTAPKYGQILYDPWNKVYYRFAFLPRNKEELKANRRRLKPSVIIIDENFNKVGETRIDAAGYYDIRKLYDAFVTKDGLVIPWKNEVSDDFLVLQAFALEIL
ncbi:MAG: DUF4221 family protein [Saprospiraceae bacterium]|nr:DUF4221 family protein [Lewinella sp.]